MSEQSGPPPSHPDPAAAPPRIEPPAPPRPAPPKRSRPRFWLTVGEIVGVLALVVAGLGYWDSHRERVTAEQARTADARRAAAQRAFVITARAEADGDRLRLDPVHEDQPIQSQIFLFPKSIRSNAVQITGHPRIEAEWFAHGLKKARDRAHLKAAAGDERIPVGVVTTYLADGDVHTDRAVYDIGYTADRGLIGGTRIRLEGLSYVGRPKDLQAQVDSIWRRRTGEAAAPSSGAKPAPDGPPD